MVVPTPRNLPSLETGQRWDLRNSKLPKVFKIIILIIIANNNNCKY